MTAAKGPDRWLSHLYNLLAPVYDLLWGREEMRRDLAARLRLQPGQRVLETGIGTGANLPYLCESVGRGGRIEGVDVSPGMLRRAERKCVSLPCPVHLTLQNAADLPFPDDYFHAVLHFGGINFFTDRAAALREMVRVARVGARLVIADETLALTKGVGEIISRRVLDLVPRLRPPLDLLPARAELTGVEYWRRGIFYVMELRKLAPGEAANPLPRGGDFP